MESERSNIHDFMDLNGIRPEFFTDRNIEALGLQSTELRKKFRNKKTFDYGVNNINDLIPFIYAIEKELPTLGKDLELTLYDSEGEIIHNEFINHNSIHLIVFMFSENIDLTFSEGYLFRGSNEIKNIRVEFRKSSDGLGYFPFWNKSEFDLSIYGIYKNEKHPCINQSCLVTALYESKVLTSNEFEMIRSFIKTRNVTTDQIKHIAELLGIDIKLAVYKVIRNSNGNIKDSHQHTSIYTYDNDVLKIYTATEYNKLKRSKRKIEIIGLYFEEFGSYVFGHYVISHPIDEEIVKAYFPNSSKANILMLIKEMFRRNLFEPMSEEIKNKLNFSFKRHDDENYNTIRPIYIPKRVLKPKLYSKVKYSKYLFGFDVEKHNIDVLLDNLQKIVDRIVSGVDVRCYTRSSDLMKRIMFEYGCFENVQESSGESNREFRSKINSPKRRTFNDKPLYLSGKYYYIDMNGAYLSFIDGIPYDLTKGCERNYKINDLIREMYKIRLELKKSKNPLEDTIKLMLVCSYGNSIQKSKQFKNKFSEDVKKSVDNGSEFICKYNLNEDGKSGFISKIQCFNPHFSHPQLSKIMYDNYYYFMDKISKLVNVLYWNIDAILVNEDDYFKLKDLGYIGSELGKFKVEKVFKEIGIMSPMKKAGLLCDGDSYKCPDNNFYCCPKNIKIDEEIFPWSEEFISKIN